MSEYNKPRKENDDKQQKFYFNEDGQLVVESARGVWVDGKQYVKMYGDFTCNAKTMGEIIRTLKGTNVEVGVCEKIKVSNDRVVDDILKIHEHVIKHYCVLGASQERIEEYERELAKQNYVNDEIKKISEQFNRASDIELAEREAIRNYNKLPWWKRIFRKVEVR